MNAVLLCVWNGFIVRNGFGLFIHHAISTWNLQSENESLSRCSAFIAPKLMCENIHKWVLIRYLSATTRMWTMYTFWHHTRYHTSISYTYTQYQMGSDLYDNLITFFCRLKVIGKVRQLESFIFIKWSQQKTYVLNWSVVGTSTNLSSVLILPNHTKRKFIDQKWAKQTSFCC